jgi:hypothetical protein
MGGEDGILPSPESFKRSPYTIVGTKPYSASSATHVYNQVRAYLSACLRQPFAGHQLATNRGCHRRCPTTTHTVIRADAKQSRRQ